MSELTYRVAVEDLDNDTTSIKSYSPGDLFDFLSDYFGYDIGDMIETLVYRSDELSITICNVRFTIANNGEILSLDS